MTLRSRQVQRWRQPGPARIRLVAKVAGRHLSVGMKLFNRQTVREREREGLGERERGRERERERERERVREREIVCVHIYIYTEYICLYVNMYVDRCIYTCACIHMYVCKLTRDGAVHDTTYLDTNLNCHSVWYQLYLCWCHIRSGTLLSVVTTCIYLSFYRSIYLSPSFYLSTYLPIYLSIYLSLAPAVSHHGVQHLCALLSTF